MTLPSSDWVTGLLGDWVVRTPRPRSHSVTQSRSHHVSRGLTFVEMLVAMTLLTLVSASIAAVFSGGMVVWERVQAHGVHDQALQVAFAQLQRDVRGVRRFAPLPFEGDYDALSFAALVEEPPQLGQLGYFFDSGRRRLCRAAVDYRDVRVRSLKDRCQPVLEEVDRVRVSYYGWDEASAAFGWQGNWSVSSPPLAVKVDVSRRAALGRPLTTQTIIVRIPIGNANHQ